MRAVAQITCLLSVAVSALAVPTDMSASLQKRGPHNFIMDADHPLMMARRNATLQRRGTNYEQDYVTGGTVNFSPGNGEFSVNWNTYNDFVVGVGWNPGNTL